MRLWLLGTGGPGPSSTRRSSGYLVEVGDERLLFDHGFGAHQRLLELGVSATEVSAIFFSHYHYDHFGDYAQLLLTRWDQSDGSLDELDVFGPPPLAAITEGLIGDEGVFHVDLTSRTASEASIEIHRARGGEGRRLPPRPTVRELASDETVETANWMVRVAAVEHFSPELVAYGYRLDAGGQSFVYSGDTGRSDALIDLARGCDVLVHMCHYPSWDRPIESVAKSVAGHREAAEVAAAAEVGTLVLSHLSPRFDQPGVRDRALREVGEIFSGTVILGEDLMEVSL